MSTDNQLKSFENVADSFLGRLLKPLAQPARERISEINVEMRTGFVEHAKRLERKCGSTRTILSRGEFVRLEKFYVPPKLEIGRGKILEIDQLIRRLKENRRIVITGSAGLGKSVFMKYLTLKFSSNAMTGPLPIFFELRDLNGSNSSLEDMLFANINTSHAFLTKSQFQYAMRENLIILFLDAFDEVNPDIRLRYEKEVISFTNKYPEMQICITSRPSPTETIEVWAQFEHARLLPFTIQQVSNLIEKLEEDASDKQKFIDLLKNGLYESHKSFLSTPLLALIMFITYQDNLQIPDKLHEFYHRAFEALFFRHDTQKKYARKMYCALTKDTFLRLLSALCAIIYFENGSTSIEEQDFNKRIESAKEIENVKVDTESFLKDLIESICVIQRDGTEMSFTHRSFQEYFTAIFVISSESLDTFSLINQLITRQGFDIVVRMIGDINKEYLEKKWVLRWLDLYKSKVENINCEGDFVAYVKMLRYRPIAAVDSTGYRFGLTGVDSDVSAISAILSILYNEEYKDSEQYNTLSYSQYMKECEVLAKYYFKRDGVPIPRKRGDRHNTRGFDFSPSDNHAYQGTEVVKRYCGQRAFLIQLKQDIENRHQQKGENFMDLIRRNTIKRQPTKKRDSNT